MDGAPGNAGGFSPQLCQISRIEGRQSDKAMVAAFPRGVREPSPDPVVCHAGSRCRPLRQQGAPGAVAQPPAARAADRLAHEVRPQLASRASCGAMGSESLAEQGRPWPSLMQARCTTGHSGSLAQTLILAGHCSHNALILQPCWPAERALTEIRVLARQLLW